jgi:hypothetical protein
MANSLPRGMISMKMALSKIGEGGGEAERDFVETLINTYFKKNHVELFLRIFQS